MSSGEMEIIFYCRTIKVACAAIELAASAPQMFSASIEALGVRPAWA